MINQFFESENISPRYERKFVIKNLERQNLELLVKMHPIGFHEIFYKRKVNNIYLDNENLSNYSDNIEGVRDRIKLRFRWYGDEFGLIEKSMLEIKIKRGLVGWKQSFKLPPFEISKEIQSLSMYKKIINETLDNNVKNILKENRPKLFNSYERQYFLSFDGRFRITLDSNLSYCPIDLFHTLDQCRYQDHVHLILELKYDTEDDNLADEITNHFQFRVSKSSKYINGISLMS